MISIYQKIQKVETLQRTIDREVTRFKHRVCIDCLQHCAACCSFSEVQATPLEFLPFAYHALKLGLIDQWHDELAQHQGSLCFFRKENQGNWGCRIYPVRGLICRLFGFSASLNKLRRPEFAACRILKNEQPEKVKLIREFIAGGGKVPVISSYYRQLAAIDMSLGQEFLPINQAIKKAIEIVYFSITYRQSL